MLVTPNWTVNPTAASAITAAVTIPKPIACRNMLWLPSGRGPLPATAWRPGPMRRGPGAAAYLMRGARSAAVIESTRLRFPFGW